MIKQKFNYKKHKQFSELLKEINILFFKIKYLQPTKKDYNKIYKFERYLYELKSYLDDEIPTKYLDEKIYYGSDKKNDFLARLLDKVKE